MFLWVWVFFGVIAAALSYHTFRGRLDEVVFGFASAVLWAVLALGATNLEMNIGGGVVYQQNHESVVFICVGFAALNLIGMLLGTGRFVKDAADVESEDLV